ncbi:hypothetical protein GDO78_005018 [Eleutherodactylus coqui]|uniref:NudC N-terminal domain-containing protein n=1 Tax=Eleutherodactylus coqui TaxID=57060 RepID=A0A8J6KDC9_ELECQ|nr:hypothetical protein GDO78_005018 [Eleutherodactylus coqui]
MEPDLSDRYDHALLGILQHVGNIQDFLNVYFGFLYRKTDFYRILMSPQERMGFPPGTAQNMVLQAFKTYERLAMQDHEHRIQELQEKLRKNEESLAESGDTPGAAEEVVVEAPAEEMAVKPEESNVPESQEKAEASGKVTEDSAAIPQSQESFQMDSDSYNGAVRENYTWSQDYSDLEIKVPVPKDVVKGRQISLSKCGEYWWNAVLEGEEKIDIDKIQKERSMATVDDEEHAVLDRLTFDYHQKLQGKPQSHEMKVHEMLKKGWDAEGSPFRGQSFDPSMFNISPGAVQF